MIVYGVVGVPLPSRLAARMSWPKLFAQYIVPAAGSRTMPSGPSAESVNKVEAVPPLRGPTRTVAGEPKISPVDAVGGRSPRRHNQDGERHACDREYRNGSPPVHSPGSYTPRRRAAFSLFRLRR